MVLFTSVLRRAATISAVAVTLAAGPLSAIARAIPLNGAGASFPAPLYQLYATEIKKDHPELTINYQAIGSGGGVRQTIAGTVDFGGSDAAMKDSEIEKVSRGIILVPTAGGAVAIPFNVPGVNELRLSRQTLGEVFCGGITNWNDPKLRAANPGVNLPNLPIKPVVRADSSGTTFIFTNHLEAASPYCVGRGIKASKKPNWPAQTLNGPKNAGVAALVAQTRGSIGYVEFAFAKQNNLAVAAVENKAGEFVKPSLESSNQALANIEFPANYRVFEGDPEGGYPIVGLTWLMVYKNYPDAAKAQAVKTMVEWILTKGQDLNANLDYTRIPPAIARRAINDVKTQVNP